MASNLRQWILTASFVAVLLASSSISGGFSDPSAARSLLQIKKPCTVDFEFMNYTIITSRCKGPDYPPQQCCDALLQFSCPYADEINDLSTDCANTMFSYINVHGRYPPGLFANVCRGDKQGLPCPSNYTGSSEALIAHNAAFSCHGPPAAAFFVGIMLVYVLF